LDDGRTSFSRHGAFGSLVTLPGRELVIIFTKATMRSKKGNKRKSGKAKTRKFNTNTTVANNDSRMAMTTMLAHTVSFQKEFKNFTHSRYPSSRTVKRYMLRYEKFLQEEVSDIDNSLPNLKYRLWDPRM
jgi:hypothetical protein